MKADVVAVSQQGGAVGAILSEDTTENVDGGQHPGFFAMGECHPIAPIITEVRVDDLSLEDIPDQPAAVSPALLHNYVANTKIVEKIIIALALEHEAVSFASGALNGKTLDQKKSMICLADDLNNVLSFWEVRDDASSVSGNSVSVPDVAAPPRLSRYSQRSRNAIGPGRYDQESTTVDECRVECPLEGCRVVTYSVAPRTERACIDAPARARSRCGKSCTCRRAGADRRPPRKIHASHSAAPGSARSGRGSSPATCSSNSSAAG